MAVAAEGSKISAVKEIAYANYAKTFSGDIVLTICCRPPCESVLCFEK